jgi:hypothetical protein
MDRLEIVGGVPFLIREPDSVISFDGGVRGEFIPPPPPLDWTHDGDGWWTVEVEDGADWLWPGLRR